MERRVAFITLCVVLVTSSFHVKSVFAARRVSIKIVARPKNEEELKGPQPFRPAALPSGNMCSFPFLSFDADSSVQLLFRYRTFL
jgi:hypothetical protein